MAEYLCIVCPNSCTVSVTQGAGGFVAEGAKCKRGERFALDEHQNPVRLLTSTVAITGARLPRLPVVSSAELPRAKLFPCLARLRDITVRAPVRCGDILEKNVCGTGVDILASRSMALASAEQEAICANRNRRVLLERSL